MEKLTMDFLKSIESKTELVLSNHQKPSETTKKLLELSIFNSTYSFNDEDLKESRDCIDWIKTRYFLVLETQIKELGDSVVKILSGEIPPSSHVTLFKDDEELVAGLTIKTAHKFLPAFSVDDKAKSEKLMNEITVSRWEYSIFCRSVSFLNSLGDGKKNGYMLEIIKKDINDYMGEDEIMTLHPNKVKYGDFMKYLDVLYAEVSENERNIY